MFKFQNWSVRMDCFTCFSKFARETNLIKNTKMDLSLNLVSKNALVFKNDFENKTIGNPLYL